MLLVALVIGRLRGNKMRDGRLTIAW